MDKFQSYSTALDSPARAGFVITPSDTEDLPTLPREIYVGTAGDVKVDFIDGGTVTFKNMDGAFAYRVKKVYATGTTATDIVGVY